MKKRTKIIIRVVGIILIGVSIFMGYKSLDQIFNGLDFGTIVIFIIGCYLVLGTENSLSSWNIFSNDDNYEEEDDYEDYEEFEGEDWTTPDDF